MKNTIKSVKGIHIVTINGKPMVCATLKEVFMYFGGVCK